MAEVLSPPMTPSSTITMLHSRPSSADHQYNQHSPRLGQQQHQKSMSNYGQNNSYRGAPAVQAYAFQKTPTLQSRTSSAPSVPQATNGAQRNGHSQNASTSSSESSTSSPSSVKENHDPAPFINWSSDSPDLTLDFDPPPKASPNRYHRPAQRRTDSNISSQNAPPPLMGGANSRLGATGQINQQPQTTLYRGTSVDDMAVPKGKSDLAPQRYKRRSSNNLEAQAATSPGAADPQLPSSGPKTAASTPTTIRPVSFHQRSGSAESRQSQRNASVTSQQREHSRDSTQERGRTASPRVDAKAVPPRGSSDANKRMNAPSPLSRQANEPADQQRQRTYASTAQGGVIHSPAAQHLAAVSDKDLNKGMKSRLRRAFSFGSAQELRKASAQNNMSTQQHLAEQTGIEDDLDDEQREIAARQEAAGIGAGIYSGQGGFTGSTDNLSISSTASSASMMLRKMGNGVKKGGRSIKGLFRPKSVIGVPAADGPIQLGQGSTVQPSVGGVSMVTVEAERLNNLEPDKLNITPDPADRVDGTDTFPNLRKASAEVSSVKGDTMRGSTEGSDSHSRRSIVGSDKDRAAVLAEVKKGILKRSGTNSPQPSPPVQAPPRTQSPVSISSTPSTAGPQQQRSGGSYFDPQRPPSRTHSVPITPNGGLRNISFSPRIQFHDAWSSQEYDRRGEIATCNRLTPMLAQQIKEELNTFKMEMEVHELSKPHTHFF